MNPHNPHETAAGLSKEAFKARHQRAGTPWGGKELTPQQREFARQQRSLVMSRLADINRVQRRFGLFR